MHFPTRPIPSLLRPLTRSFNTTASRPLARISIIGRLASPPEMAATSTGNDIIRYAIGTSSGPRDNRTTSWWKVSAFVEGGLRDALMGLGKGSQVYVEGNCIMGKFTDKDGNERSALNITQRHLEILDRRGQDDSTSDTSDPEAP